ncbi:hypothetical protein PENSPDRAFT_658747 [Peniophora sp. CONT]|nr:hypothetical protein PENSPDRAFT_658747 [Peniophora sp. CONT]
MSSGSGDSPVAVAGGYSAAPNGPSPSSLSPDSSDRQESHGGQRIPLACHRCRAKRGRCTGEKPICAPCVKASAECTWPEGRRKKRTRREMEADERAARESANMGVQRTAPFPASSSRAQPYPPQPYPAQIQHAAYSDHSASPQDHIVSPVVPSPAHWDRGMRPAEHQPPPAWNVPQAHHARPQLLGGTNGWPSESPSSARHGHSPPSETIGGHVQPLPVQPNTPSGYMALHTDPPTLPSHYAQSASRLPSPPAEDDLDANGDLELFYYRFSGPQGSTAVAPGINRISLKLQRRARSTEAPVPDVREQLQTPPPQEGMFDEHGMPLPNIHLPLLELFFKTAGRHFPSVNQRRMHERLETQTMSAFFMNCICAISARFDSRYGEPAKAAQPFITKAQELIVPLLHLPTNDVATGLLLLAWACFGQNSDSGLWQYSGMATRMALDLGIHEVSEIYESSAHVVRTRLFFWSIFVTDRIIALYTGRLPSFPEDIIEIPLPTDEDFFPDTARSNEPDAQNEPVEPVPFNYLVRLMVICGRIATVLNGRRGRPRTLAQQSVAPSTLSHLQKELVQFYADLPESLKWGVETFKHQEARGHGGTFVTLHLWANAVMALTYHTDLTMNPAGVQTPLTQNMERSVQVALSCARNIVDCVRISDAFGNTACFISPFCVQPIFIASLAFIHDAKAMIIRPTTDSGETAGHSSANTLLKRQAHDNLKVLNSAMQRMDHYWAGIAYVSGVLEQKALAMGFSMTDPSIRAKRTFVALRDQGLLRRFTGGSNLPHNTAPATETSLWNSMAKEMYEQQQQQSAAGVNRDGILSAYTIEDLFVQPAGTMELEQFLAM